MQPLGTVTELTPRLVAHLKKHNDDLHELRWDVFEHLIAELLSSRGFEDVRTTGRRSDTTADIIAIKTDPLGNRIRYFVEIKHWINRIGVEVIDQVHGALIAEGPVWGWHLAVLVTLAGMKKIRKYTPSQLKHLRVEVRDKSDVVQWLDDYIPSETGLWLPMPDRRKAR